MKDATIVFDLDGTLVDTAPDLINATNFVMTHAGLPPVDYKIARTWISHGARVMISRALEHAGAARSSAEIDALLARFLDHYSANIAAQSQPFPGAVDVLSRLQGQGARLSICTNKREGLARALLDELSLLPMFEAITGRDTLAVCKPDPGHILGTIDMAGGSAVRAVMVGDSANDINAAKAAKVPSIAVSFGYSSTPAFELGADVVIDHFSELEANIVALLAAPEQMPTCRTQR